MDKFKRGYTYIASGGAGHRYLVQQVGLKSWRASLFTHAITHDTMWTEGVYEGNALSLYEKLIDKCKIQGSSFEVREYSTTPKMRKGMFDILMYGYFKD